LSIFQQQFHADVPTGEGTRFHRKKSVSIPVEGRLSIVLYVSPIHEFQYREAMEFQALHRRGKTNICVSNRSKVPLPYLDSHESFGVFQTGWIPGTMAAYEMFRIPRPPGKIGAIVQDFCVVGCEHVRDEESGLFYQNPIQIAALKSYAHPMCEEDQIRM
jgi:hypothetical protein